MGARAILNTEIQGDIIAVSQTRMRKRITVRSETGLDGIKRYVSDTVYEPLTKPLVSVPVADLQNTNRLTAAFKSAGIPVTSYDEIRDALFKLPHMKLNTGD